MKFDDIIRAKVNAVSHENLLVRTDTSLAFTLPWPPSVNTYWRSIMGPCHSRVILSERGRRYRKAVSDQVLLQGVPRHKFRGRLEISVLANPPDKRKRDLDNLWKGVLDGLQHSGVVVDDSHFDRMTIERGEVVEGGKLQITIGERT